MIRCTGMLLTLNPRWRTCLAYLSLLAILTACAAIPTHRPLAPDVELVNVKPLNLSLQGQRLAFTLRVSNPNKFDLPLRALNFTARVEGERIANGLTNERVTIPANGNAQLEIVVTVGIDRLIDRFKYLLDDDTSVLAYDVAGTVSLGNWPTPIAFNHDGKAGLTDR